MYNSWAGETDYCQCGLADFPRTAPHLVRQHAPAHYHTSRLHLCGLDQSNFRPLRPLLLLFLSPLFPLLCHPRLCLLLQLLYVALVPTRVHLF